MSNKLSVGQTVTVSRKCQYGVLPNGTALVDKYQYHGTLIESRRPDVYPFTLLHPDGSVEPIYSTETDVWRGKPSFEERVSVVNK